jgi:hypothetical protein
MVDCRPPSARGVLVAACASTDEADIIPTLLHRPVDCRQASFARRRNRVFRSFGSRGASTAS